MLYDMLLNNSEFPEQDKQLLMTCDNVIIANNILDYCTKMGVLAVRSQSSRFTAVNMLDITAIADITPIYGSVFIEFNWKNRPDIFEEFPLNYGVHILTMEDKNEIWKVFDINRKLFRQCKFDLDKQRFLIENNIKWLYVCRVYSDYMGLPSNLTFWFVACDKDGKMTKFINDSKTSNYLVCGAMTMNFRERLHSEDAIYLEHAIINVELEFVKMALLVLSSLNCKMIHLTRPINNNPLYCAVEFGEQKADRYISKAPVI